MVDKVHGMVGAGQFIGGGYDVYTVRTTLDIRATGVITEESQKRLDKLIQTVSTRAQPIVLEAVTVAEETSPADIPSATGAVDVYTLKFAINHKGAWEITDSSPTLGESLNGIEGFVYDIADTADNNVAVALIVSL